MAIGDRIWAALTAMVKLEGAVERQADTLKTQQLKIENLTERVIRLETALEISLSSRGPKRLTD